MKRAATLLLSVVLPLTAHGCTRCPGIESDPEIRKDVVVATQAKRLEVATRNGDIVVREGSTPGEVVVTSNVVGIGPTPEAALALRDRVEIVTGQRDGTVTVGWDWTAAPADCEDARVRFEITAPPEWFVQLDSNNGDVSVHGAGRAGVELSSDNGDVRVLAVDGPVKAESRNGSVQVNGAPPTVDLETMNGAVRVELLGEGPVSGTIDTMNGEVTVWMGERSATVSAASSNGGIDLRNGEGGSDGGVRVTSSGKGSAMFGDLQQAEAHELVVDSNNGGVQVRKVGN